MNVNKKMKNKSNYLVKIENAGILRSSKWLVRDVSLEVSKGQIVTLESTTYPGTTEEELLPRIESTDLKVGEDIFLVYSPEREDPGNTLFTTRTIPKVLGGITPACLEVGKAMYGHAIDQLVEVSSTKVAEMNQVGGEYSPLSQHRPN